MEKSVKIHIDKADDLAVIAEKVFSADAEEVIIIVPKFSKLAESDDGLRFLKRGLSAKKKRLLIESVDDSILSIAKKTKIAASNPFFNAWEEKEAEEIGENENNSSDFPQAVLAKADEEDEEPSSKIGDDIFEKAEREINHVFKRNDRVRRKFQPGIWLALLLIIAGGWAAYTILPQAEIKITTKKEDWNYTGQVIVDKDVAATDAGNFKIPGQIFSQKKNLQMSFAASGKEFIKQKAVGKIIIYNAYSSQPQPLVASTRFETPDGKVFRLNEAVVVPGAKIIDGKIEPSVIEASIIADKPGKEYNIGPTAKLTIPGFKDSPKFSAFYGEVKLPLTGGFSGETAVATAKDIEQGKEKALEAIKSSLELLMTAQMPEDFLVPEGISKFKVINEKVDPIADDKNEFSVYVEAELAVIGFREKDLLGMIVNQLNQQLGEEYKIKSYELSYKSGDIGFDGKQIGILIDFSAIAEKPIDVDGLKKRIASKSEDDLRAMVFSLPGLDKAVVSLWPFWVSEVPDNLEKIDINID